MFFHKKIKIPPLYSAKLGLSPELLETDSSKEFLEILNKDRIEGAEDYYKILDFYSEMLINDKKIRKKIEEEYIQRNEKYISAKKYFKEADKQIASSFFDKSIIQYEEGIDIYPFFFPAWLNLGYAYQQIGDISSIKTYRRGLEYIGADHSLFTSLFRSYAAVGNREYEIEFLNKALESMKLNF